MVRGLGPGKEETKPGYFPWAAGNRKRGCGETRGLGSGAYTGPPAAVRGLRAQGERPRGPTLKEPHLRVGAGPTAPATIGAHAHAHRLGEKHT